MSIVCIQTETLTNIADNLRLKIADGSTVKLLPQVINDQERLKLGSIICKYRIFNNAESYIDEHEQYTHYEYLTHPITGKVVPVFYETVDNMRQEGDDSFWYDGRVTYNNEELDSWKAISDEYTLEGPQTQTIYTNIVTYVEGDTIPVTSFAPLIANISGDASSGLQYHKAFFNQSWAPKVPDFDWDDDERIYKIDDLNSSINLPSSWEAVADYDHRTSWSMLGTDYVNSSVMPITIYNRNPYYYLHIYFKVYDLPDQSSGLTSRLVVRHFVIAPNSVYEDTLETDQQTYFDRWSNPYIVGIRYDYI